MADISKIKVPNGSSTSTYNLKDSNARSRLTTVEAQPKIFVDSQGYISINYGGES